MILPWENPEFIRNLRGRLQPRTAVWVGVIGVAVSLTVFGFCYAVVDSSQGVAVGLTKACKATFLFLFATDLVVLFIYGGIQASQAIVSERELKTMDFQRLTPQGALPLIWGKILGAPVQAWFFTVCTLPMMLLAGAGGRISFGVVGRALLIMLLFGLSIHALAVAVSSFLKKMQHATAWIILYSVPQWILGMEGSPSFVSAPLNFWLTGSPLPFFAAWVMDSPVALTTTFFGYKISALWGFAAINLFIAAASFLIAVRRFRDEDTAMLSVRQVFVFFGIFQLFMLGGTWDMFPAAGSGSVWSGARLPFRSLVATFGSTNCALLTLAAFLMVPTTELLKQRLLRAPYNGHWGVLFGKMTREEDTPPTRGFLGLAGFAAAVVLGMGAPLWKETEFWFFLLMCTAIPTAVYFLLLWLQHVMLQRGKMLTIVIIILCSVLPPLFIGFGTKNSRYTVLVSPFAYTVCFSQDELSLSASPLVSAPVAGKGWLAQKPVVDVAGRRKAMTTLPFIAAASALLLMFLAAMRIRFHLDLLEMQRKKERRAASPPSPPSLSPPPVGSGGPFASGDSSSASPSPAAPPV